MKRYSDRGGHRTMAELNVTPLLDLAFVLLIIFMITTPLIENGVSINLPKEKDSTPPAKMDPNSIKTITIKANGDLFLESAPTTLPSLQAQLTTFHQAQPDGGVIVRTDKDNRFQNFADVVTMLKRVGIEHMDFETAED